MVNGKKVRGRRYQMIDNIMINGCMKIRKGRLRRVSSVQVSAQYNATLHTKHITSLFLSFSKGPQKMLFFLLKAIFCYCYPLLYFLTAVHVATDITPQVFVAVHLFDRFIFNSNVYLLWLSSDNHGLCLIYTGCT